MSLKNRATPHIIVLLLVCLVSGTLLVRLVQAQDADPATITVEREVTPTEGLLGEVEFAVTLTLTGDSSSCPVTIVDRPLDIMLVIDRSGSMADPTGGGLAATKIRLLQEATQVFLDAVALGRDRVGVVVFDDAAYTPHSLTDDRAALVSAIEAIQPNGGTAIDTGVLEAQRELQRNGRAEANPVMIVLTDGRQSARLFGPVGNPLQRAEEARNNGIRVITIGLGEDVDRDLLRAMASQPDDFYAVAQAGELAQVYAAIAHAIVAEPAAGTDVIVRHQYNASAFEIVPGSVTPPTGVASGNEISWPVSQVLDAPVHLSYRLRPRGVGTNHIDLGNVITYNPCGQDPQQITLSPGLPVSVQEPTPTPTNTPAPSPTSTPSPTPTTTPAPTWTPTPSPSMAEQAGIVGRSLLCNTSWLSYLLALLLLLFFLWWLWRLWRSVQSRDEGRQPGCVCAFCHLIPWLAIPLTLILFWLILSRLDLCPVNESVYFWRIDAGASNGQIFVIDREGLRPSSNFTAVNRDHGCVGCHAVSSTGRRLAAVAGSGAGEVVVYDLDGRRVEIPNMRGSYVNWSPDGRRLAISTDRADIVILDVDTGQVSPLAGASEPGVAEMMPTWSHDGRQIAFVRGGTAASSFMMVDSADIYVVPANGGAAQPVPGASGDGFNYYPAFSPDGRWLAFTRHTEGNTTYAAPEAEIFLVPASGGQAIRLAANDGDHGMPLINVSNSWPTWSLDGEWLAFNSKRDDPSYDLFISRIDENGNSGGAIPLPGAATPGVFEHLPYWGLAPEVSPWAEILNLWPFLLLYLFLWFLYWLCCRLCPAEVIPVKRIAEQRIPPEPLPPLRLDPLWQVAPTLVLGVGGTGRWVLTHLKKSLRDGGRGKLPEGVQLVLLDTSEREDTNVYRDQEGKITGVTFAGESLAPDEILLVDSNLAGMIGWKSDAALADWFPHDQYQGLPERAKNLASGTQGRRPMARAGLIAKLRQGAEVEDVKDNNRGDAQRPDNDASRLWQFLHEKLKEVVKGSGEKIARIAIVGSFAGGMSGTLLDLAYLARLAAEEVTPEDGAVHLEGFFTTARAFRQVAGNRATLEVNTLATARELQRFQLVAGIPFTMDYRESQETAVPDHKTDLARTYSRKLFDEVVLFGSHLAPEYGTDKSDQPWATTFAAMADVLALRLDRSTNAGASGDYRDAIRRDAETKQNQRHQSIVSSAGSFTYRLPLMDILDIVHTRWASKLFHVFLMGDQPGDHISFDPAGARMDEGPEEMAGKFVLGEYELAPTGMRVVGLLALSGQVEARRTILLAEAEDRGQFAVYLRRVLGTILNGSQGGNLERRAPRLGYALRFINAVDDYLSRALQSAQNQMAGAPMEQEERSWWQRWQIMLGSGQANQDEWQQVIDKLTAWSGITARSRESLDGVRQLLIEATGDETGQPVVPGLYAELRKRQAEAEARPKEMNQVAVRRYLWSRPVDPDKDPANEENQSNLAEEWYALTAERLKEYLHRFFWHMDEEGTVRLSVITFQERFVVPLDDRRPETVRALADQIIDLANHATREWAQTRLADVLLTQFSSRANEPAVDVARKMWQVALPHVQPARSQATLDFAAGAVAGVPPHLEDDPALVELPQVLRRLDRKLSNNLDPRPVTVLPFADRTALSLVREYNLMPLLDLPELQQAWQTYCRNAGRENDRLVESPLLATAFAPEWQGLAYERRLEEPELLNQDFRLLHPLVVMALQRSETAEAYALALAAGWLTLREGIAYLQLPGATEISLVYEPRRDLPPLISGLLHLTITGNTLEQQLKAALERPGEQTRMAWRTFIDAFRQKSPESEPPAPSCSHCGRALQPGQKFCTNCGEPATAFIPAPAKTWREPFAGEPQMVKDLAALAALAAYRRLVTTEEWDRIVMARSRRCA
jgi:hypothetical protein